MWGVGITWFCWTTLLWSPPPRLVRRMARPAARAQTEADGPRASAGIPRLRRRPGPSCGSAHLVSRVLPPVSVRPGQPARPQKRAAHPRNDPAP